MIEALQFWLSLFGMIAVGLIGYGVLKNKVDQNKEDIKSLKENCMKEMDDYKAEVDAKFKEKKEAMEKNHSVMWEKIDTFSNALNNISQLIVRVETKLDIYSKKE